MPANLTRHVLELIRLAGPVVVTRAGILTMALVDVVMVGRYSTQEIAYLAIGNAPVVTLIVTSVGLMMGTLVMTAKAFGAGELVQCGVVWRRSVPYGFVIGLIGLLSCAFGEQLLLLSGQTPDLSRGGGTVMLVLGLGLPANLVFVAGNFFLEAIKRPLPGMAAMVGVNLLNVLLNWVLIYGHWGFPALGAAGSAWATTLCRIALAVMIVAFLWNMRDHKDFGIRIPGFSRWRDWADQRRLGYASGLGGAVESSAFSILTLFAGWLGTYQLAAFSIATNLIALIFMVALGFGTATAVRVGFAYGRRDPQELALAGWTGLGLNTVVMCLLGAVLFVFPGTLASIYSSDPELIALAAPLIGFTAFVMIADGGQVVMVSTLRGRGDAWLPVAMYVFCFYGLMVPLSWWFAFKLDQQALGLYQGILITSVVSILMLALRFHWLSRRDNAFFGTQEDKAVYVRESS